MRREVLVLYIPIHLDLTKPQSEPFVYCSTIKFSPNKLLGHLKEVHKSTRDFGSEGVSDIQEKNVQTKRKDIFRKNIIREYCRLT